MLCSSLAPRIQLLTVSKTASRTLEDIDRYFEANRGIIVCRNKLATQLHRPQVYIEEDERIAEVGDKGSWTGEDGKDNGQVTVEKVA